MKLNTDLSERIVIRSTELPWIPSPVDGIQRRLLARDGAEDAQATSIVRYEPGAIFSQHIHLKGEEIIVLDGEFIDEFGVYPVGTYIKNPPGSKHTPRSDVGCTLFVKLRQMADDDVQRVVVHSAKHCWHPGLVPGLEVLPLSQFGTAHTAMVRWAPNTFFNRHFHYGGEEVLVLQGVFQDEYGKYPEGTWIRNPHMSTHQPYSIEGCLIFVKVGHLSEAS